MARSSTRPAERSVEKSRRAKAPANAAAQDIAAAEKAPNPVWFKPVMFGFMLLGVAWLLVFYVSGALWPVPALGNWNIGVAIGLMLIGFIMTTRWR